jgi:RPA family protein
MEERRNTKRETAFKVNIKDIKDGKYIKVDKEWEPNYIETLDGKKFSRVNILGTVASELIEQGGNSFVLDDGTDNITIRSFDKIKQEIKLGDLLMIIGRPREFSNEAYVMPEIIKKIEKDKEKWVKLRKLELKENIVIKEKTKEVIEKEKIVEKKEKIIDEELKKEETIKEEPKINSFDVVLKIIKELDINDDGAEIEEIISKSKMDREIIENIINNLLMDGEAFEIKPGRLKLL